MCPAMDGWPWCAPCLCCVFLRPLTPCAGWAQDKLPAAEKAALRAELAEHQSQLDRLQSRGNPAELQAEHRARREQIAAVAHRIRARVREL